MIIKAFYLQCLLGQVHFIIDTQCFVVCVLKKYWEYFGDNGISFIFAVAILIKGCGAGVFNFEGQRYFKKKGVFFRKLKK